MQMVSPGLLERNAKFIEKKNRWLENAQAAEPETCTFKPQIITERRPTSPVAGDRSVVERLYAYLDYYEKRRAECKNKLNDQ